MFLFLFASHKHFTLIQNIFKLVQIIEQLVLSGIEKKKKQNKTKLSIRFSELAYKEQEDVVNVPLYLACRINRL